MWSDGHCGTGSPEPRNRMTSTDVIEPARGSAAAADGAADRLVRARRRASPRSRTRAGSRAGDPRRRALPLVDRSIGALIQYAFMFGLILAIAHGLDRAPARAPSCPSAAGGRAAGARGSLRRDHRRLGDPEPVPRRRATSRASSRRHGTRAGRRRSSRMRVVVALVAPFVEELLFRGLGYGLLTQFVRRCSPRS